MRRGFLNTNRKPIYTEFSGSSASHEAVWESLSRLKGSTQVKAIDITEVLKNEPKQVSTPWPGNAGEKKVEIISGVGQTLTRPNFEDKNKSVLIPNLLHRIPSLAVTQARREPFSFCLLWSSTLNVIARTAGYPAVLPKTRLPTLVVIKSTPDMGLGLFAKHDIKVSELVLAERPLLVIPPTIPIVTDSPQQLSSSAEELCRSGNEHYEEIIGQFLGLMRSEDADAFKNLENRHAEDGSKLFGIVLTNGYRMNFGETDEILAYHAVGNKGSRINHSCTPNLFVDFNIASFTLQYTALRDIKAGEQLFYAYCNPMDLAKVRQEGLGRYKFVCRCTACENATPESDKARVRYGIKVEKMSSGWKKVLLRSEFKGSSLKSLLDMEEEIMKEGLDFWLPFPLLLDAIAKVYTKLHDQKKASEYKEKLARYNPAIFKAITDG